MPLGVDRSTMQVMFLLHAASGEYRGPGYIALLGYLPCGSLTPAPESSGES